MEEEGWVGWSWGREEERVEEGCGGLKRKRDFLRKEESDQDLATRLLRTSLPLDRAAEDKSTSLFICCSSVGRWIEQGRGDIDRLTHAKANTPASATPFQLLPSSPPPLSINSATPTATQLIACAIPTITMTASFHIGIPCFLCDLRFSARTMSGRTSS